MGSTPWYRDRTLRKVLFAQLVMTAGASALALPWSGEIARAVVLGGAACVCATMYCGSRLFGMKATTPEGMSAQLLGATLGKLVVAAALLLSAMAVLEEVNVIALCLGYVAVQVSGSVFGGATGVTR